MKVILYTNENTSTSYVIVERDNGETEKSEPHSLEEYEMFRLLHIKINSTEGEGNNPFVQMLLQQLMNL